MMIMLVFSTPSSSLLRMGGIDEIFAANEVEKLNSTNKVELNLNLRVEDLQNKNNTIQEVDETHFHKKLIKKIENLKP